jgi:hypothetical protein
MSRRTKLYHRAVQAVSTAYPAVSSGAPAANSRCSARVRVGASCISRYMYVRELLDLHPRLSSLQARSPFANATSRLPIVTPPSNVPVVRRNGGPGTEAQERRLIHFS